jgi:hypothetical protein
MAITLAQLQTRVIRRLRADKSEPAAADLNSLHVDSITEWFKEVRSRVVEILRDSPADIQALIVIGASKTLTSGSVTISDLDQFEMALSIKTGTSDRYTPVLDQDDFSRFDGSSFILTVPDEHPIAMVSGGTLHVKPTSVAAAKIDYAKHHPDLSATQATVWSDRADRIATELIAAKFFDFKGKPDRAQFARNLAENI